MAELIYVAYIIIIAWVLMVALEKKGWLFGERHAILILLRTKNGREMIGRIARYKGFWRVFSTIGVILGLGGMAFMGFTIVYNLYSAYFIGEKMMTGQLVIPGVTVPLSYGIIGLVSVLLVHEVSHGIIARSEDISLKSLGAVFLTVLPVGAFVEPDEEEMKGKSRLARLRVYSAGSFANILLAVTALIGLVFLTNYAFDPGAVQVVKVVDGSPAAGILERGMVLESIQGKEITSMEDFFSASQEIPPDQDINIRTDDGSYTLHTDPREDDPDRGLVGIQVHLKVNEGISRYLGLAIPLFIFYALSWIFFLNQGIGLINLAPLHLGIAATDGHHILRESLARFVGDVKAEQISLFVSFSMVFFLILGITNTSPVAL